MRRLNLVAAALSLLLVAVLAGGVRCLAIERCTLSGLFGGAPPPLDVPYAETRTEVVEAMLDMAELGPGDRIVDLGTGDGRILIAAARRGAHGLGVDIDPTRIRQAEAAARSAGVESRTEFRVEDLFETPIADADVVAMFLLPEVNLRLRPRLLAELAPGARVVSHAFDMGDWQPDATRRIGGATIHFWRIPARIEGRWALEEPGAAAGELDIRQRFQRFGGTLSRGDADMPVTDGRIAGERIAFAIDGRRYDGVVRADTIEGTGWRAIRIGD